MRTVWTPHRATEMHGLAIETMAEENLRTWLVTNTEQTDKRKTKKNRLRLPSIRTMEQTKEWLERLAQTIEGHDLKRWRVPWHGETPNQKQNRWLVTAFTHNNGGNGRHKPTWWEATQKWRNETYVPNADSEIRASIGRTERLAESLNKGIRAGKHVRTPEEWIENLCEIHAAVENEDDAELAPGGYKSGGVRNINAIAPDIPLPRIEDIPELLHHAFTMRESIDHPVHRAIFQHEAISIVHPHNLGNSRVRMVLDEMATIDHGWHPFIFTRRQRRANERARIASIYTGDMEPLIQVHDHQLRNAAHATWAHEWDDWKRLEKRFRNLQEWRAPEHVGPAGDADANPKEGAQRKP